MLDERRLDVWLTWCLNRGTTVARRRKVELGAAPDPADALLDALRTGGPGDVCPAVNG